MGAIALHAAVIIGVSVRINCRQRDLNDYYLANRTTPWWHSGLSTMATQLGAISFVSAPAFVAMKPEGGLKWLCYEFGVPIGILVVMAVLAPLLHRGGYLSIYEYLEKRFDGATRSLVSFLFQIGRGLATAVTVLAGGIILSTALSISTPAAILLVGVITIFYDVLGGIRVVILSDVLQMGIILIGIVICGWAALNLVGWEAAWASLSPERARILDFSRWGVTPEGRYGFWPMALGGVFLYASYYGCDQSQMQRELSVGTLSGARNSLLVNALGRFPVVVAYCLMGVFVGAVFAAPEGIAGMAARLGVSPAVLGESLSADPDRMLPLFILTQLPHGVIGFLFVAIMAALMSSLDSGLNSLSAVTVQDFYKKYWRKEASDAHYLRVSKICTLLWGVFCVASALLFAHVGEATRQTTIVLINAVGSLLYGPILAAFLLGALTRWADARSMKWGVAAGIVLNLVLWQCTPISWLWWNATGFFAAVGVAFLVSVSQVARAGLAAQGLAGMTWAGLRPAVAAEAENRRWRPVFIGVGLYFFFIVAFSFFIQQMGT